MKTKTINLYSFSELSEDAKKQAIENERNARYNYNEYAQWAIDDCYLFMPLQTEIDKLKLGDELFIKNTRKNVYFDTDRNWYLDIEKAFEVVNEQTFLTWLEIPLPLQAKISFVIHTPIGRNRSTEIEFEPTNDFIDILTPEDEKVLQNAIDKFSNHVDDILRRIEESIEYNFTDEAIIESLDNNEDTFTEDGKMENA